MPLFMGFASGSKKQRHILALLAGCALLGTLEGCGDGGSGGGGGINVVPVTTPSPSVSPTPSSTPAPTGSLATVLEADVPGLQSGDSVDRFQVTNRGLYMRIVRQSATARDAVAKLHGDPRASTSWTIVEPETVAGSKILTFAPSSVLSEGEQTICFYYAASQPGPEEALVWGKYTASAGGVTLKAMESRSTATITYVAPASANGCLASRSWILYQTMAEDQVRQDDGTYSSDQTIIDRFGMAATPPIGRGLTEVIVSHPTDSYLYVGAGNTLSVYDGNTLVQSWSLPEGSGHFTDLIWYNGDLFVGYGGRIYKLSGTTIEVVIDEPIGGASATPGRFCLHQGEIFAANGEAIDLQTKARRSWISKGVLSSEQSATAQLLAASLSTGIFCSATNASAPIYAPTTTNRIRMITPVNR